MARYELCIIIIIIIIMNERTKLVLGETGTGDLPILSPTRYCANFGKRSYWHAGERCVAYSLNSLNLETKVLYSIIIMH